MREIARGLYRAVPYKQPVFEILRPFPIPERLYRHLHFRGVMRVPVEGECFRIVHGGSQIENEVFWSGLFGKWEGQSLRLWVAAAHRARVILDVGANSGLYSLAAKTIAPAATVVAVEPIERIRERLRTNVELNGFDIGIVPRALSDRDGTGTMLDTGQELELRATLDPEGVVLHGERSRPVSVPIARLDTLVGSGAIPEPDLLKIDVEGHEAAVLRGMPAVLDKRPRIVLEVHSDEVAIQVGEILEPLGYPMYRIDHDGPRRIDQVVTGPVFLGTLP